LMRKSHFMSKFPRQHFRSIAEGDQRFALERPP
jgi:hypothetical protein